MFKKEFLLIAILGFILSSCGGGDNSSSLSSTLSTANIKSDKELLEGTWFMESYKDTGDSANDRTFSLSSDSDFIGFEGNICWRDARDSYLNGRERTVDECSIDESKKEIKFKSYEGTDDILPYRFEGDKLIETIPYGTQNTGLQQIIITFKKTDKHSIPQFTEDDIKDGQNFSIEGYIIKKIDSNGSVTLPQPYEYGSFRFQENEETFLSGAKGRVKRFYLAYDNDSRDKTYNVYCGFPNQYILNKLTQTLSLTKSCLLNGKSLGLADMPDGEYSYQILNNYILVLAHRTSNVAYHIRITGF